MLGVVEPRRYPDSIKAGNAVITGANFIGKIRIASNSGEALVIDNVSFTPVAESCPDTIAKPHTFVPGTPAKASEVNQNLDVLYQTINDMACEIEALKTEIEALKAQ